MRVCAEIVCGGGWFCFFVFFGFVFCFLNWVLFVCVGGEGCMHFTDCRFHWDYIHQSVCTQI